MDELGDRSCHAEFWIAVLEPDQDRRIVLANMWIRDLTTVCTTRVFVDGWAASSTWVWDAAIERARVDLGREIVSRCARTAEKGSSHYAEYRDLQVTLLLGPAPRSFGLPPARWLHPSDKAKEGS